MQCSVCKKEIGEANKPTVYDVHEILAGGEIGTGFRLAFCPPSVEGNNCEQLFRALAQKAGLEMVPVDLEKQ